MTSKEQIYFSLILLIIGVGLVLIPNPNCNILGVSCLVSAVMLLGEGTIL